MPSKTPPLLVDIHEPTDEIVRLLKKSIPVEVESLNSKGLADYVWMAHDHHSIQVERKQNVELLADLDAVERQLRHQYDKADENMLLIEGFIAPAADGSCLLYRSGWHDKFSHEIAVGDIPANYNMLAAWLYQLDKVGITHFFTSNMFGTASLLIALYNSSMKASHETFTRYIKQKIFLQDHNPHIMTLMGVAGANLGEVRATALIKKFKTSLAVLNASEGELCQVKGIGETVARRLLEAVKNPYKQGRRF